MERYVHLETYDARRFDEFSDILCEECAHFGPTCSNAVVVIDAMRSRGNDMSVPVFDFSPNGELSANQCPGMWPSEAYLRATGQTMRKPSPEYFPTADEVAAQHLLDQADAVIAELDKRAPQAQDAEVTA